MANIRHTCFYEVRHGVETLAYFQDFKNAQSYYETLTTRLNRWSELEDKHCMDAYSLNTGDLEESVNLVEEIEHMGGSVYMDSCELYVEELSYRD